jgi:hypothetical protein
VPRPLTTAESALVRWLLAHHMPRGVQPVDVDFVRCARHSVRRVGVFPFRSTGAVR